MKGKKDSQHINKPALKYLVPEFIMEMGKVLKCGEIKYGAENWKLSPLSQEDFNDARLRHAFTLGIDKESNCDHLVHEAINCMFVWWYKYGK